MADRVVAAAQPCDARLAGWQKGCAAMYLLSDWNGDPQTLNVDKHEDLIAALAAIREGISIAQRLLKVNRRGFSPTDFLAQFNQLRFILPFATRLVAPLNWELDPIAARHGIAEVGDAKAGNHLWAARMWLYRFYTRVVSWNHDYARARNDINAEMYSVDAFKWARERILKTMREFTPVDWVAWGVHVEQEIRTAVANRNEMRSRGVTPPVLPFGTSAPAPSIGAQDPNDERRRIAYVLWQFDQKSLKEIDAELNRRGFGAFRDPRSVRRLISSWANQHNLLVRKGQSGRPKRSELKRRKTR